MEEEKNEDTRSERDSDYHKNLDPKSIKDPFVSHSNKITKKKNKKRCHLTFTILIVSYDPHSNNNDELSVKLTFPLFQFLYEIHIFVCLRGK